MKPLLSIFVAGSLAIGTAGGAAADPWHYAPYPPPHASNNIAGAIVVGTFLGLALGTFFAPRPVAAYPGPYAYPAYPPAPGYPGLTPHAYNCLNVYGAAYDIASDSWIDPYGRWHRCTAPY